MENVNVSLNKGLADVDFKPGNTVAFKQLQDAIAKNGFTTKQSSVVVRGTVENVNGKYLLKVSGTPDSFALEGDGSQLQTLSNKQVQVQIEVQGTLPEAAKGKLPDKIQVSKMEVITK